MTIDGKVSLGPEYREQVEELERLTGKRDYDLFRLIVENLLYDAKKLKLKELPVQAIGIKEERLLPK